MARLVCVFAVVGLSAGFRVSKRRAPKKWSPKLKEHAKYLGLTSEEVDSLDWVRAEDVVGCMKGLAACKANSTECGRPCTLFWEDHEQTGDGDPLTFESENQNMSTSEAGWNRMDPGDMIAAGELVWTVVKDNKPAAGVSSKSVSVKREDTSFAQYSQWKEKTRPYFKVLSIRDPLFGEVAHVSLKLHFWYWGTITPGPSGKHVRYVANMYAYPEVSAWWPTQINIQASRGDPINAGGLGSTACASMTVNYQISVTDPFVADTMHAKTTARCDGYSFVTAL